MCIAPIATAKHAYWTGAKKNSKRAALSSGPHFYPVEKPIVLKLRCALINLQYLVEVGEMNDTRAETNRKEKLFCLKCTLVVDIGLLI